MMWDRVLGIQRSCCLQSGLGEALGVARQAPGFRLGREDLGGRARDTELGARAEVPEGLDVVDLQPFPHATAKVIQIAKNATVKGTIWGQREPLSNSYWGHVTVE